MDAVQKVGNGHPGTAMSLAPAAYLLFQKVMRHNPADPRLGRPRPVRAVVRALAASRSTSSSTSPATASSSTTSRRCAPGAARPRATPSTATPPASRPPPARSARASATRSAWRWPPAASAACSTRTPPRARARSTTTIYAIASDGDLEEGVSGEASSLAGTQQLGNLDADLRRQPDLHRGRHRHRLHRGRRRALRGLRLARAARRLDQRRHRLRGGRPGAVRRASRPPAGSPTGRASSRSRTIIAWPAPNAQNTGKAHGSALGDDEVAATKKVLGFDPEQTFEVADEVLAHTRGAVERGKQAAGRVAGAVRRLGGARPPSARSCSTGCAPARLPAGWETALPVLRRRREGRRHPRGVRRGAHRDRPGAARAVGRLGRPGRVQQHHHQGRAVASSPPSTSTKEFTGDSYGRVLHFGIREHAHGLDHERHRAARRHPRRTAARS